MSSSSALRARWRAIKALVLAFVAIDLRAQHYASATGVKRQSELISPLVWVMAQFVAVSALLTATLIARVDATVFTAAHLGLLAILVGAAVLVEATEILFVAHDRSVLGWRPLHPSTISTARLINLGGYVGAIVVACSIFPAVVGMGLHDGGWRFGGVYVVVAGAVGVIAACAAVVLTALLRRSPVLELVRQGLAWVQIVLVMILFYAGQLMLRDSTGALEVAASSPPTWLVSSSAWGLAAAVARAGRGADIDGVIAVVVVGAVAVGAITAVVLAGQWGRSHPRAVRVVVAAPKQPGTLSSSMSSSSKMSPTARATSALTWLVTAHLRRDARARGQALLALAMPVSAGIVGHVAGALQDPSRVAAADAVFCAVLLTVLTTATPAAVHAVTTADVPGAARRLLLAPVDVGAGSIHAVRSALWRVIFVVPLVVLAAALLVSWGNVVTVVAYLAVAAAAIDLGLGVAARDLVATVPLSLPTRRGSGLVTSWRTLARTAVVGSGLAAGFLAAARTPGGVVVVAVVSVIGALLWRRTGGRHVA